ncbi:ROK family protein [Candidatus Pacebacteria bacterium]|nr:ROK family protein [Candidatus Paceibacterota bacterium]
MTYVLFDIGGTKTRVAISEDLQEFGEPKKFDTPQKAIDGVAAIVEAVKELTDNKIEGIAGGMRGILDPHKTMMLKDPGGALPAWEGEPIGEMLKKALKADVYLENDTAIVGLGEWAFGAGKDCDIVAYHTVSTGVGGARIVDGHVDAYASGFEPGHQILDIDQTILGEEESATLENLVSGSALERHAGIKPYDIPQSDAVWDQLAEYLGYGLRNTILYWSPDVIVLGGSMIVGDPRILLADIERHTHEIVGDTSPMPAILDAELGDFGGLYGAMARLGQNA